MEDNIKQIGFTVDSGLINRLGIELVGKAETAVSELIKNAYDADATEVTVEFINSEEVGGTLIITDNGLGMTEEQLINGFMRISSTDKIHNPKSIKFGRTRAGKKGIGRFATQCLGSSLTIETQPYNSTQCNIIDIDWDLYEVDSNIENIRFPLYHTVRDINSFGTKLIIRNLRGKWNDRLISKIFDYVNTLFQPTYLSERCKIQNIASKTDKTFNVTFKLNNAIIANEIEEFYDKALFSIEGYVGNDHKGVVLIDSVKFKQSFSLLKEVEYDDRYTKRTVCLFPNLVNIRFKCYYFIYDVKKYKGVTSKELNTIKKNADSIGSIYLYRNGFRVLPFGEPNDDWIHINQRWSNESGTNIPFNTKNVFGFVEILDDGYYFEETSSREGLVENEAYKELIQFVYSSLYIARTELSRIIKPTQKSEKKNDSDITINSESKNKSDKEAIADYKNDVFNAIDNNPNLNDSQKEQKKAEVETHTEKITELIKENEMLRVLASLGLSIGEFAHEVVQLQNSINNHIYTLDNSIEGENLKPELDGIINDFDELFSYTNYFGVAVSQNLSREKQPVLINKVVKHFIKSTQQDIDIEVEQLQYGAETMPMHYSEWSSILANLYTNSRKAIRRKKCKGKILIQIGIEGNNTVLLFNDNGDGIKEEDKEYVFDAFFTKSNPIGWDSPTNEHLIGTGLGLKIIKDIVVANKGTISVVGPAKDYSTCFKITIPKNKSK